MSYLRSVRLYLQLFVGELMSYLGCSVRLYLQLFVGGLMSYLRYLLFVYSGVQHILVCVIVLFFFVLCTLYCQFLWIVHFWLPLRYSLTFIYSNIKETFFLTTLSKQAMPHQKSSAKYLQENKSSMQSTHHIQWDLSNPTHQGTREMCRIVQDVGILRFYFN